MTAVAIARPQKEHAASCVRTSIEMYYSSLLFITIASLSFCTGSVLNINRSKLPPPPPPADAATRAYQTLEGVFNYYWKSDPLTTQIKFMFTCGEIGGWGKTRTESECSCDDPKSCVNCYRWFDAVMLESLATYGIYMKSHNHSEVSDIIYDHSPYNGNWNATLTCTFIDDFTWYGIAYLRVYEWLKDPKWLDRSLSLYDWVWQYGWDNKCGGFWWNNCDNYNFKDSITIVEILHFSAKLAYMFPNESRYREDSVKIWNWFFSFGDGYGLMSDKYLVSTGAIPEKCCNSTVESTYSRCYNSGLSGTSYNQGLLMSASAYLYLLTGNAVYLNTGLRLLDGIQKNYTTSEGILIDEPRSYQSYAGSCWGGADPGGDWYSFNGIFMLHLGYFAELLSQNKSLQPEILNGIKSLVDRTSDAAWNRSSVWPPFDHTDSCNIGVDPVNPKANYPKFHWWWGKDVTLQSIPPDPRYFFHRRKLSCTTNKGSSPLWNGKTKREGACLEKCKTNEKCAKYQFKISKSSELKKNCWLWSFNRSDYTCRQKDLNFNIGIKRPVGNATCSSKCGSKDPQPIDHGVCYCDSSCAVHMDCCLDYADHCQPAEPILCKGNCTDVTPRPIPHGGYCWCFDGCNGWFTDNNSDGSCCSDYPQECILGGISMPTCLDGRSQGSALNLFLTQIKLSTL